MVIKSYYKMDRNQELTKHFYLVSSWYMHLETHEYEIFDFLFSTDVLVFFFFVQIFLSVFCYEENIFLDI